jgi:hypothetical protein
MNMENKSIDVKPSMLEAGEKFLLRQYEQGQFMPAAVIDKTENAGVTTVYASFFDGSAMQMISLTDMVEGVSVIKDSPVIDELNYDIRTRINQESVSYKQAMERNDRTIALIDKYFGV